MRYRAGSHGERPRRRHVRWLEDRPDLLHSSLNRNRFKDKIMQQFKALQRPLRVRKDARRCRNSSVRRRRK
ncbi:hypothetical protein B5K03_10750 [Rhizobium phaseoli]|nr:hypothetical protein B5K03_10750 [Rhizobium phaseoli]